MRQPRVLCIDSNASRNLAVYLLERAGFEVITTSVMAEAADMALNQHFDLHVLNHKLVDELEIESCEKLHEFQVPTPMLLYSTVSYPYSPIQPIHCRSHNHLLEPVNVCDVVDHAFRTMTKSSRTAEDGTIPIDKTLSVVAAL